MNILMISYGDYDFDGRLRELHKTARNLGTTYLISRGSEAVDENHCLINDTYPGFVKKTITAGKKLSDIDVLFLDNRKSVIPGLSLKKVFKNAKIVLDCRELYLSKYVKHPAGKIGCFVEKRGIKKADVIICANKERADFMREYYKLEKCPLVYENLRALEYSSDQNEQASKEKFRHCDVEGEVRIISTSGCDLQRTNDILVKNLPKVEKECRLFLVGNSPQEDVDAIKTICADNGIRNVEIVGRLNQDDLKALISYCQIGIVNYHQRDINNKYCASGKIYEYLYEGLPVVTTTNPPLKALCDSERIGESDDDYYNALNKVIGNYQYYKDNVAAFTARNRITDNNGQLITDLKKLL